MEDIVFLLKKVDTLNSLVEYQGSQINHLEKLLEKYENEDRPRFINASSNVKMLERGMNNFSQEIQDDKDKMDLRLDNLETLSRDTKESQVYNVNRLNQLDRKFQEYPSLETLLHTEKVFNDKINDLNEKMDTIIDTYKKYDLKLEKINNQLNLAIENNNNLLKIFRENYVDDNVDNKIALLKEWIKEEYSTENLASKTELERSLREMPNYLEFKLFKESINNNMENLKDKVNSYITKDEVFKLLESNDIEIDKRVLTYSSDTIDKLISSCVNRDTLYKDILVNIYSKPEVDKRLFGFITKKDYIDLLNRLEKLENL